MTSRCGAAARYDAATRRDMTRYDATCRDMTSRRRGRPKQRPRPTSPAAPVLSPDLPGQLLVLLILLGLLPALPERPGGRHAPPFPSRGDDVTPPRRHRPFRQGFGLARRGPCPAPSAPGAPRGPAPLVPPPPQTFPPPPSRSLPGGGAGAAAAEIPWGPSGIPRGW